MAHDTREGVIEQARERRGGRTRERGQEKWKVKERHRQSGDDKG
jgi:hypothetical protein